jgi:hypothetical protein
MASGLLYLGLVMIRLALGGPADPERELPGGQGCFQEILEGDAEFLEAIAIRLNEIVTKPKGRFVISYLPGSPGARRPPRTL